MFCRSAFLSLTLVSYNLVLLICAEAKPHGFHLKSGHAHPPVQENGAWVVHSGKKAMIDWESFSIDQKEIMRFQQMDSSSYVLNRVIGKEESALLGQLLSNGAVYLINPNGILIGPNAYIETAGFIASTLDLLREDLAGKTLHFAGDHTKGVVNQGVIHCPAGDIFLIGHHVENTGTLSAPEGRQGLLAGFEVVIQPQGAPQVHIRPDKNVDLEELAENPYALAIRHRGTSVAKEVYFDAEEGLCEVSGNIAAHKGDEGGEVRLLGMDVHLLNGARIDASGPNKGGVVLVGGDYQGKNPEIRNAKHVWAGQDTEVFADALEKGDGGKVIFWSDEATLHYGKISIRGGPEGGDGGFAEVSGKMLDYRGLADGRAPQGIAGTLLLDPTDIVIGTTTTTASFSGCGSPPSTYNINTSINPNQILWSDLQSQLGTCSVVISTVGSGGGATGSITVSAGANIITWGTGNTTNELTLTANSFLSINSALTNTSTASGFTAMNFTANGTAAGATLTGIALNSGGVLTSSAGGVTLNGTSPATAGASHGVTFNSGSIVTGSGAISITGTVPTGSTAAAHGINMATTNGITSTSGPITLTGATSASGSLSFGVEVSAPWGSVTSGTVTFLNCTGSNNVASGHAVDIDAVLTASGDVTFTNCHGGTNFSVGVNMRGPLLTTGAVTGTGITGNGNAGFFTGQTVSTSGLNKAINLTASCTGAGPGIHLSGGSLNPSNGGSVILNGSSTGSHGILLDGGGISTTTGAISLTGTGGTSTSATAHGIHMGSTNGITSTSGTMSLTGQTFTTGTGNGINMVAFWTTGTMGTVTFSNCIGGAVPVSAGVYVENVFSTGGDFIGTGLQGTGNNGGIGFLLGSSFQAGGNINITASASGTSGSDNSGIVFTNNSQMSTTSGNITLNGTSGPSNAASYGILFDNTMIQTSLSTTSGSISLTGAASGTGSNVGIMIQQPNGGNAITSTSGTITLIGTSTASGSGSDGISITNAWAPGTSNTLSLTGTGGTTAPSYGVNIGAALTLSGPLTLHGTSGGGAGNYANAIGANILSTGKILTISGSTFLTGTATLDTTDNATVPAGANIIFSGSTATIDGTQALTLTAGSGGAVTFGGVVGGTTGVGALTVTSASAVNIANNITASSFTTDSPVPSILAGSSIIDTTGAITFGGTVDGTATGVQALTLIAGTTSLSQAIGGITPLASVAVSAASIGLGTSITTSNGAVTFTGPTTISGTPSIDTTHLGAVAGANISFSGTTSTVDGAVPLSLRAGTGTINFGAAVGGMTPPTNITFTSSGGIHVANNITVSGANPLNFAQAVTLTGPSVISTNDNSIAFSSTLDGANTLSLNAGMTGTVTFTGAVGSITPLTSLTVNNNANTSQNSSVVTTGAVTYTSAAIHLGGSITTTLDGPVTFTGPTTISNTPTIDTTDVGTQTGANISFSGTTSTVDGATTLSLRAGMGVISFGAAVGGSAPPTNITFTSSSGIHVANNITVSGANPLNFAQAVTLTGPSVISNANNGITFASTLDGANALSLNAGATGTVTFTGAVGSITPLPNLIFVDAAQIDVGSNITVSGANLLSFPFPVLLTGGCIITPNDANVTFLSTLDGTQAFTVNEGIGTTAFDGNVGGTTPLGALSISGTNGNFSVGAAVTTIRAHSFSIGSAIPTTLNNTALLTIDTSSGNGPISFVSTIDGASAGAQNLALNAGTGSMTFSSAIGDSVPLGALDFLNATNITASHSISASSLTQTAGSGTTTFDGLLVIGSDISLTGNNFTFNTSDVTANNVTIDNAGLLSVPGATLFFLNGAFSQTGTGPVQIRGDVITANQNIGFNSGVTLLGNLSLDTGGAPGNITFVSTVDGPYNLTLNAGNVSFGSTVGGTPLNSLHVTAAGTITTGGNQTVSSGPMVYDGEVIVTMNTVFLNTGAQPTTFQSTSNSITGNFNVTLRALNSSVTVASDIDLSGSNGSAGGSCVALGVSGLTFGGQILTQGGSAAPGIGGHGGTVNLTSNMGSVSVHNINTSGGDGTVAGGTAGNILLQPSGSYSGGFPVGIIVLNNDLSLAQDGNLVANAGTGGTGSGGIIMLSANNRSSPATVATITSSDTDNDISVSGAEFIMGLNEAMTCLGNLTISCPDVALGDLVALDTLTILATTVNLLIHGDETLLDKHGASYISPSLHFLGGNGYVQTGTLNPPGPLNAQDLMLPSAVFRPLLILGDPVILNFDTSQHPIPPSPPSPSSAVVSRQMKEHAIYKLAIADAELSDLLPVGPCPEPYKLRWPRCPLPMTYEVINRGGKKVTRCASEAKPDRFS